MAKQIGGVRSLSKLQQQVHRLKAQTRNAREKAGETMNHIVRTAEISGVAFGAGVLRARMGDARFAIAGVPLDLGVGLGAHLACLLGTGADTHFAAVGDGALAHYMARLGMQIGGKGRLSGDEYLLGAGGGNRGMLEDGDDIMGQVVDPVASLLEMSGGQGMDEDELEG